MDRTYDLDVLTPQSHHHDDDDELSTTTSSSTSSTSSCCRRTFTCNNWLLATSLPFLAIWGYVLFLGITQGLQFLNDTHWSLDPPAGSPSLVAKDLARSYFTQKRYKYALSQAVLVVAHDPTKYPVTHSAVANFTHRVLNSTIGSCNFLPRHNGMCWWRDALGIFVHDSTHPVLYEDSDVDVLADFLSPDNVSATFILLTNNDGFGAAGNSQQVAAWDHLQTTMDRWLEEGWGEHYDVSTTHEQMLLSDSEKGVIADFEHGDMITLPIAWFILLLSCGPSAALVLLTLPVTLLGVFYVLDQVATGTWVPIVDEQGHSHRRVDFPSFTPAIFINMIIAISLDYGLFMLTRYREEVERARSTSSLSGSSRFWMNLNAVAVSTSRAGRVVFISGVTLGLTMVGLTFCSVTVVAAIGWGGAAACTLAVLVHLTMLPALLVALGPCCCFPLVDYRCSDVICFRLWSICSDICGCSQDQNIRRKSDIEVSPVNNTSMQDALLQDSDMYHNSGFDSSSNNSNNNNSSSSSSNNMRTSMYVPSTSAVSVWIKLGQYCRDHKFKVTFIMLLSMIPFVWLCSKAQISVNQELLTPSDSRALQSMKDISKYGLNAGWLNPVVVLVANPDVVHSDGKSSKYGQIVPPCHDDNLDLRQLLATIHDKKFDPNQYPPSLLTCENLEAFNLGICEKKQIDGHDIQHAAEIFCPGTCSNYCDARQNPHNRTILLDDLFLEIESFRNLVHSTIPEISMRNIRSVTTVPFQNQSTITAKVASEMLAVTPRSTPYQAAFQRYTNYNHTAVEIQIILPFGQSCGGSKMLREIRSLAQSVQPNTKYGFEVYGDIGVLLDSVDEVFRESPGIVALVTLVVVFVMAGLAFRSCLIPIRLLGTVIVTLLYVAGCTVLMYQYILGYDGIYWFVPICTACLVIGLTIDYDVFLIRYDRLVAKYYVIMCSALSIVRTLSIVLCLLRVRRRLPYNFCFLTFPPFFLFLSFCLLSSETIKVASTNFDSKATQQRHQF